MWSSEWKFCRVSCINNGIFLELNELSELSELSVTKFA